MYQQGGYRWRY